MQEDSIKNKIEENPKSPSITSAIVCSAIGAFLAIAAIWPYSELAKRAQYGAQTYMGFDVGFYALIAIGLTIYTLVFSIIALFISIKKINKNNFALALALINGILTVVHIAIVICYFYCANTGDWAAWFLD